MNFETLDNLFEDFLPGGYEWLAFAVAAFVFVFVVINTLVAVTAFYTWFERRAIGRFHARLGPNRWGPYGLLQPMADVLKLITKEDTVPETADRIMFFLAPVVFLAPTFIVFALIPFGEDSFLGSLNVGILFVVAITGVNTFGIFMGGWSSRNKYAIFGAVRSVAILISYEVPMALSLVGVVLVAGSMSLLSIADSQSAVPYLFVQPLGFLVFLAAASAEMNRTPFDLAEGESELGGGYLTEYSGMKFGIFQLAEFMAPLLTASIATVLFLGGTRWGLDPVPGQIWFLVKAFIVVFFLLWVRSTWPRLRVDQMMGLAWKGLLPLALVNLLVVAVEVLMLQDPGTGVVPSERLWWMAAFNWPLTIGSIIVLANILGQRRLQEESPGPLRLADLGAEAE